MFNKLCCRVVAAAIRQNQLSLLVQENEGPCSGLWGFPLGNCEEGETARQSAERETQEETGGGKFIADPEPLGQVKDAERICENGLTKKGHILIFGGQYTDPEKRVLPQDIAQVGWFTDEEIADLAENGQLRPEMPQILEKIVGC